MGRALQRRREARWGKEKGAARRKRTTRGGKHPGGVPSDPSYTVNAGRRVTRIPGSTHADRSRDFALENIGEKMVLSSGGRNIRDWITHAAAGKPDDPISMPAETTSVHRTLLITRIILARVEPHSLKISNRTVSSEVFRYSNESFSSVPERILSNALPDWSLKEEETRQRRIRRMNEGLLSIRSQFDSSAKSFAKNTSLCFRIRHRGTKQTNGGRLRLQKHDTGLNKSELDSLDSHLYSSIRGKNYEKKRSFSLPLSLSPPFFRARHARETAGGFIRSADSSRARHLTVAILPAEEAPSFRFPVRRSSARFLGRRARLRGALRSAGDWLSLSGRRDADATFAPPFRLPLPLFDRARPPRHTDPCEDAPSLVLGGHRMCFVPAPTDKLSLPPPLSVYFSLSLSLSGNGRAPERSRTQGCWPAVTHPSAGCHSIYSLEDRARGWRMME